MYGKYMITARDIVSDLVRRFFIPAANPEAAVAHIPVYYQMTYQITEVKDVTEEFPIDAGRVFDVLGAAGFSFEEKSFIVRLLCEFGIASPEIFGSFISKTI